MPSFVDIGSVVFEKKIFQFRQFIFSISFLSPALHLNKVKFPSPKDALCQDWLKLAQWF